MPTFQNKACKRMGLVMGRQSNFCVARRYVYPHMLATMKMMAKAFSMGGTCYVRAHVRTRPAYFPKQVSHCLLSLTIGP